MEMYEREQTRLHIAVFHWEFTNCVRRACGHELEHLSASASWEWTELNLRDLALCCRRLAMHRDHTSLRSAHFVNSNALCVCSLNAREIYSFCANELNASKCWIRFAAASGGALSCLVCAVCNWCTMPSGDSMEIMCSHPGIPAYPVTERKTI